jgi:undecaprenyl-diphosphatase
VRPPARVVFELLQAIVLGLLQGLTEFLPVSSSGHLQGVPYLLGWDTGSLAFDVSLHTATLVAVVAYFRHDLWGLTAAALGIGVHDPATRRRALVMIGLLAIGTVPAAVAGVAFAGVFEAAFASPRAVAGFLYVTAVLLWLAERIRRRRIAADPVEQAQLAARDPAELTDPGPDLALPTSAATAPADGSFDDGPPDAGAGEGEPVDAATIAALDASDPGRDVDGLRVRDAVAIGLAQALAIFPGISRSGATIAMGMSLGLSRRAAARYSFLLSVPIIIGATLATVPDLGTNPPGTIDFGPREVLAGMVAAGVSGYWAIATMLRVLQHRDLLGFARYVVVFATVLLVATFVRA